MKILVTGGRGTVGTPLVKLLRDRGNSVSTIDTAHSHEPQHARVDVSEYRQLKDYFDSSHRFDMVYHAAAEFGRHNGDQYYETCWKTNAIGTRHMLELQKSFGFKMVFFSSSEIYGDYEGTMIESLPMHAALHQMNDYAMSKWVNEMQIVNMTQRHNLQTVRVRLFNTYGPGEYYNEYRSVVARFSYYALHAMPYTVHLDHKRSFSYIDDTVRALANIAINFHPGEVYNIGSIYQYDIKDVSEMIHDACGTGGRFVKYEDKEQLTTTEKKVDNRLSREHLDYWPTLPLEQGIRRTVEWMRQIYGR
jgi:dTDP-glucose 4,6-dehydratase